MITQFRGKKPISYTFMIVPYGVGKIVAFEGKEQKSCCVELQSFDNFQEIVSAVRGYMETNFFDEAGKVITVSEILKDT